MTRADRPCGHFVVSSHVRHFNIRARMESRAHVAIVCDALEGRALIASDRFCSNAS